MTNTNHTAEEVRANVTDNCRHMTTATEAQLTAYADLLERLESVTDCNRLADRAAFEQWMIEVHCYPQDDLVWQEGRNCYADYATHLAWQAWNAALAAQTTGVRDEIAEEAWRAFYKAADKVQKESQSNG